MSTTQGDGVAARATASSHVARRLAGTGDARRSRAKHGRDGS
ncbi:hypothetical protein [Herbiconiux daphne]|uniref:Uncharacterized protein n=1 Tax=Herbiconiux daphne TaxID=2970914 RepID=A0ABT2H072_9MICO|nr:hypothetical protein [Herbiconiux daphne]MCS5733045.1 hypothetical protein [Herbiconiux daphne]